MAITKIDKNVLRTLEPAVLAKLNETLGADFGLHFNFKGGNYDRDGKYAVLKLEIAVKSADGVVVDKARSDWEKLAELYDCVPAWLDQTFVANGNTFQVKGLLPNRRKNCVSIVNTRNGEKRICSPNYVRMFLRSTASATATKTVTPIVKDFVLPPSVDEKREVEKRIADMKADGPENYYADGELKAAGMSEKAIYNMHFETILKQLRAEKNGKGIPPMKLFMAPRS